MEPLPYQAGSAVTDISEATTTESCITNSTGSCDHSREVFVMVSDITEDDEEEGDISSDKTSIVGEMAAQRDTQQRKNRQRAQ